MFSIIFIFIVLVYNSDADIQDTGSQMIVKQVKVLKCSSDLRMSHYPGQMVAYQEWNQVYVGDNGSEFVISHLEPIIALVTMFTVELEKFDNNTDIYSSLKVHSASNAFKPVMNFTMHCSGVDRKLIRLVDDGYYQYKIDSTLIYDDTKIVKFSCPENAPVTNARLLHRSVAWINSAGDKIFPYNEPVITLNATELHNSSMLCCVYYVVTRKLDVQTVRRFVNNKTLLIYRKRMANNGVQPSGTTNPKTSKGIRKSNTTNETGKNLSTTINGPGTHLSTINEIGKDISTTTINTIGKDSSTINEIGKDLSTTTINPIGKDSSTINEIGKDSSTINEIGKDSSTINEVGKKLSTTTINPIGNDSSIINEIGKDSSTINEIGKDSKTINGTGLNPNITNTPDKNFGSTTSTDSNGHDTHTTNYNIVIVSSISVLVLILLVSIVAIRKRCWKKNAQKPRPPCQLPPNEPASHTPFYVNLLFRRECDQEIRVREEPQYEEIIYQ